MKETTGSRILAALVCLIACSGAETTSSEPDASLTSDAAQHGADSGASYTCPAPACNLGSTQFKLTIDGDPTRFCTGTCSGWLSITTDTGMGAVSFGFGGCGIADCCSCQVGACPGFACTSQPLTAAGLQTAWAGETRGTSTCGGDGQSCSYGACAPAGNYIATMCASVNPAGSDAEACPFGVQLASKCTKVPFRFPDDKMVMGTITP